MHILTYMQIGFYDLHIFLIVTVILSFVFLVSSEFPGNNQMLVQPLAIYFPKPIKGKVKKIKEQKKSKP